MTSGLASAIGAREQSLAGLLQLDIVIGRHSVDTLHDVAVRQQAAREMEADEAGGAGDEKAHGKFDCL
jgi:hypothetical protein